MIVELPEELSKLLAPDDMPKMWLLVPKPVERAGPCSYNRDRRLLGEDAARCGGRWPYLSPAHGGRGMR